MIQTNLREIDMRDIDAARVVADLEAFHANVLMINAAGIIASYPTKLPYHFQSPYLTGSSLAEIVDACHRADIRVIARTDFSKVRRPVYEEHPGWAYRTPEGGIVDYNGDVHVCINGAYQQECMFEILRECLTAHEFDGVFFNMGGYQTRDYSRNYHGICHCEGCRRRFGEMFGLELPGREDRSDPACRKYRVFQRRTLAAHAERLDAFLRALGPDLCVAGNLRTRRGFIRQESGTGVDRPLPRWQYSASDNTRWAVGGYPEMVSSNTTVDFVDIPYRHVAVSPHEQRLRLAQSLANGGALDYYLIGRLDDHEDRSGFEAVKELFHFHAAHEDVYRDLRPVADIALVRRGGSEYRGWFRFLVEHHFLFDVLRPEVLLERPAVAGPKSGTPPWEKYRALVLPDLECVGDELAAKIDRFVEAGGALIATGRSGLRDDDDEPRERPAMACLGVERVEFVREDMRSAYFKLDDKSGFRRFDLTDLILMDGPYVYARYAADARARMRLVPPHHFGPPERCYYRTVVDRPAFTVRSHGEGVAVHVPWLPGALFYRQGYPNTADFAADLLEGICGLRPVGGNLSPMVEVTLASMPDGARRVLHLVNGSGHFGVSYFAPVPMTGLEVELDSPRRPDSARSLVLGSACEFTWSESRLTVRLPRLDLFDALVIE